MSSTTRHRWPGAIAAIGALLLALALAACGSSASGGGGSVSVVGYSTPEEVYTKGLEPAFEKTSAGKDASFSNSFGASGDQSRAVEAGQPASLVHFSQAGDMTRLVDAGKVSADWDKQKYNGIAQDSVVVIVTRKGNPKGIHTFDDLVKKNVSVVTPNPFSSGSARCNIMAIYGAAVAEAETPAQARNPVKTVLSKAVA